MTTPTSGPHLPHSHAHSHSPATHRPHPPTAVPPTHKSSTHCRQHPPVRPAHPQQPRPRQPHSWLPYLRARWRSGHPAALKSRAGGWAEEPRADHPVTPSAHRARLTWAAEGRAGGGGDRAWGPARGVVQGAECGVDGQLGARLWTLGLLAGLGAGLGLQGKADALSRLCPPCPRAQGRSAQAALRPIQELPDCSGKAWHSPKLPPCSKALSTPARSCPSPWLLSS